MSENPEAVLRRQASRIREYYLTQTQPLVDSPEDFGLLARLVQLWQYEPFFLASDVDSGFDEEYKILPAVIVRFSLSKHLERFGLDSSCLAESDRAMETLVCRGLARRRARSSSAILNFRARLRATMLSVKNFDATTFLDWVQENRVEAFHREFLADTVRAGGIRISQKERESLERSCGIVSRLFPLASNRLGNDIEARKIVRAAFTSTEPPVGREPEDTPKDLIRTAVVEAQYHVSRRNLLRDRKAGLIKDHTPPGAHKNSSRCYARAEIAARYQLRK